MTQSKQTAMEQMRELQRLNQELVQARHRQDEPTQQRIKNQLEALLARHLKKPSPPPEVASEAEDSPEVASEAEDSPEVASENPQEQELSESMRLLKALKDLNLQITEARKNGEDTRVKRLQEEAQRLMKLGSARD